MEDSTFLKDTYPQWLKDKSFDDCFDWANGIYSTFEKFMEYATLHDSYWCGIQTYLDNSLNLIISFDAFWNKEIANHPSSIVKEWPYLVIKIENVYNLIFDSNMDCGGTIGDVKSELIDQTLKDIFVDNMCNQSILNPRLAENIIDHEIYKTRLEDVCSGFVEILHSKMIRLLMYDSDGIIIDLPKELKVMKIE